jgi:hypothetical protein
MSAVLEFPQPIDVRRAKTAELRALAADYERKARLTPSDEAQYDAIAAEIEWRLTHIRVRGVEIRISLFRVGPCAWIAHEADYDIGMPLAQGCDEWDARDELQSVLEDGETEDSAEVRYVDSLDAAELLS